MFLDAGVNFSEEPFSMSSNNFGNNDEPDDLLGIYFREFVGTK
jgi:hypothetical protein